VMRKRRSFQLMLVELREEVFVLFFLHSFLSGKFIYKGMFIKYARDAYDLYGGDEFAQKSASHELKSTLAIIACCIPNLHVPLMALINYHGYRMIVTRF
jgi:hypothetical protein